MMVEGDSYWSLMVELELFSIFGQVSHLFLSCPFFDNKLEGKTSSRDLYLVIGSEGCPERRLLNVIGAYFS